MRISLNQWSVDYAPTLILVLVGNERRLNANEFPFLVVDAIVIKERLDHRIVPMSALIASGINDKGKCEILGMMMGNSETKSTWSMFFRRL